MSDLKGTNIGLESLLELDGEIFPMEKGYWTKIEAKMVQPNDKIPHGIKYSLTLFTTETIREFLVMTMLMGLSPKIEDMEQRKLNGITNMINTTLGFTNLRVLASYWKISGRM